jgi:SAM-dependent methyltransferase
MFDNPSKYKEEKWLMYLYNAKEINYNYKNLDSVTNISKRVVFEYVRRCFLVLDNMKVSDEVYYYVSETLKWMDVAKCGNKNDRKRWLKNGYNLKVHNLGSASIYQEHGNDLKVYELIKTHGLLGQYIQGEVNLKNSENLVGLFEKELLREILIILNKCILNGVYDGLYESVETSILDAINKIVEGHNLVEEYYDKEYIINRLKRLRKNNYNDDYSKLNSLLTKEVILRLGTIFSKLELWYFEVALKDFSLEEVIKILMFIKVDNNASHLTFEDIMKMIYFDYNGKKVINLYKKRIIENYLASLSIQEIIDNNMPFNKHLNINIINYESTLVIDLVFSKQATKLIEFCEISYGSDETYNKAVLLLYDLFGFRRDIYDRFYNEETYLKTMNQSLSHKAKILEYLYGKKVLDVGPGGGALLDLIEETFEEKEVYGIDISKNVIENLNNKKRVENKKWTIIEGDALNLESHFNEVDTIIYSSIIHELYSYIPYEGKKFNYKTIFKAIDSAYNILPIKGRIIIRDGIMTEPKDQYRIIEFKNEKGIVFLNNYCHDFKGRKITYSKIDHNKVKMLVNDAMEFLYTYTWGDDSYAHEINEQFGYFTPNEFIDFFEENFKNKFKIIELKHFLQDGYEDHLSKKINIYDENFVKTTLPDSTCIIVVEKIG